MQPIQARLDERLISQAKRLARLTQYLSQHLPVECEGHYHVANIRNRTLILITDSPVWTTRLRQLAPRILELLASTNIAGIQHVNVSSRVSYQPARRKAPAKVRRSISTQASEQIAQTAEYIEDEALKRALKKLARHR